MTANYEPPGVYIEEISQIPPSIGFVETAIPAFIGYTANITEAGLDLTLKPTKISSMVEYEKYFGKPQKETGIEVTVTNSIGANIGDKRSPHIMNYALQMFYANGGGPCYIVSVGTYEESVPVPANGNGNGSTTSSNPITAAILKAGLDALEKIDEPTLILFPEAQNLTAQHFTELYQAALNQCNLLKDRFVIMDVHGDMSSQSGLSSFRAKLNSSDPLQYGAAYGPNVETSLEFVIDESRIKVPSGSAVTLESLKNSNNQLYEQVKAAIQAIRCVMPPSSAIAGVCASVDNSRGVWKAPANVSLNAVIKPIVQLSKAQTDKMNVDPSTGKSINAIRSFLGKGTLVWGARTLAGNDREWRYVNVRRFFIFVEESIKKATENFVFEPNDANTWVKVQAMIENFLTTLWRQGALQGIKPEHAFYVSIGLGKTMTADDILDGKMIIKVGLAAVRPAEFIILAFSHKMAES